MPLHSVTVNDPGGHPAQCVPFQSSGDCPCCPGTGQQQLRPPALLAAACRPRWKGNHNDEGIRERSASAALHALKRRYSAPQELESNLQRAYAALKEEAGRREAESEANFATLELKSFVNDPDSDPPAPGTPPDR